MFESFDNILTKDSALVESNDINRLDIILEGFHRLLDKISGDLIIFDGGTNLNLEDTVSDGLLLPLGLPEKTVHLDAEDLVGKSLKVSLLTPWLDIPNDERLGNRGGLLLLRLGLLSLLLHGLGSGSTAIATIITEEIIQIVLLSSWGSSLLLLLLGGGGLLATIATLGLSTLLFAALGATGSSSGSILTGTNPLGVTSGTSDNGELAHLEPPSSSVGECLADTAVEDEGEGDQEGVEGDNIGEGKSITNEPCLTIELTIQSLHSILD